MKYTCLTTLLYVLLLSSCKEGSIKNERQNSMQTTASKDSLSFTSGYADVNGLKLYYEIHGTGEPLVLIHGGGSTIFTNFSKILPVFAKTRKVIAVEMQAHGRTSDRNAPESFETDADDVAELLKQLNIPKADIMGFSNGGSTGLQIAIRHPDRVNKLIAISAIYKRKGMFEGFFDFMQKGTIKDMPQIYKDAFLSVTPDQEKLQNMFNKDRQRMLDFKDWKDEDIKSIKVPVLVMLGDKDVVRAEHGLEMVKLLPNASLAILPGGHGDFLGEAMTPDVSLETVEATASLITNFLEKK